MNNYLKTFLRGSCISLFGAIFLGILNYLIRRFLCNNLSLADYGIFYSTFALLGMIFGFTDLGLTQSGTVMIAAAETPLRRDAVFSHLFFIKLLLALLCGAGIFMSFHLKNEAGNLFFLIVFLVYFAVQILNGTLQALWNGQKKYSLQQLSYSSIALLTLLMLYFSKETTLNNAVFCFFLPVVILFAAGIVYSHFSGCGTLRLRMDKEITFQLLSTGGLIAVTTTLLSVMYYMDTVMLNMLKGAESVGLYNVALPIMQIVQAAMIFPAVFLPVAVDMSKKGEYRKLLSSVHCALIAALAALVPVWWFFDSCSNWLIRILFKPEYTAAASSVTLLCLGLVFFTLGNFLMQIMLSLKKTLPMAAIAAISAAGNFLLNYSLIRKFGPSGAAGATLISYMIFALLTYIVLVYILKGLKKNECCQ